MNKNYDESYWKILFEATEDEIYEKSRELDFDLKNEIVEESTGFSLKEIKSMSDTLGYHNRK